MPPKFIYFDLGNVLLFFDHQQAARQMAETAGVSAEKVWAELFESDLELRYEAGQLDDRQFYDEFCRRTSSQPEFDRLLEAGSDIFKLNQSLVPVVAQLDAAGYRLGILSNTCPAHWVWCSKGRFGIVKLAFEIYALSYQLGCCKPDPRAYAEAARLAGVEPREIFYIDDLPKNVAAARQAGFDAAVYTTTAALVDELGSRGVRFNY